MTTAQVTPVNKRKTSTTKKAKDSSTSSSTTIRTKKIVQKKSSVKKNTKTDVTPTLSAEERYQKICEKAYYIAEKRGFKGGNPENDWLEAESQIDTEYS